MSSIQEEIERIICKDPSERTDEEVSRMMPWFKKKSEVFRLLKPGKFVDL